MFGKPLNNFLVFISKGPCVSVFKTCMSKGIISPYRLTCPCRRRMARSTSRALGMLSPVCRRWSSGPRVLFLSCAPSSIQRPFLHAVFFFFFCCWQPKHLQHGFLLIPSNVGKSSPPLSQLRLPRKQILGEYRAIVRLGETGWGIVDMSTPVWCAGFVSKAVSISAYS